jgi:hypothetical protein
MSQLLNVRNKIEKATERQKDLSNQLKDLKKRARDLSARTQSQADRLAGRALFALVAARQPHDSAAVLAKAIELARPSEADALEVLTERLAERTNNAAPGASQVETDTAETSGASSVRSMAIASPAPHPSASASTGANGEAIATASTSATPARESEAVGAAAASPIEPSGSTSPGSIGYVKPLRRLV